jgi:hypothetical protein
MNPKGLAASPTTLPIEVDENHRDQVDGFIARNREALNASIRQSRGELEHGDTSGRGIDQIIADGRRRRGPAA